MNENAPALPIEEPKEEKRSLNFVEQIVEQNLAEEIGRAHV